MDYFYSPFACSFAGHVLIVEGGLAATLHPVSLQKKRVAGGLDFLAIAPKGQVPVLRFDDGRVLTESVAVLLALARLMPGQGYLPQDGTVACDEALEWLGFITTELHKHCLYPLFSREAPGGARDWARQRLPAKLALVSQRLAGRDWLAGDRFGIADAYLAWVLMLAQRAGFTPGDAGPGHAALARYWRGLQTRPAVAECLAAEAALYPQFA